MISVICPQSIVQNREAVEKDQLQLHLQTEESQTIFRDYSKAPPNVLLTYQAQHKNQTIEYVNRKCEFYGKLDKGEQTMKEVLQWSINFKDESDPDTEESQQIHAYQTAEYCRKKYPNNEWYQLVALIHDVGKYLALFGEPQWSIVGDIYPVGVKPESGVVFLEESDWPQDYAMDLQYGIYKEKCGITNLKLAYGHDQYMYQVLQGNSGKHNLPEIAWKIIKLHSFYPWHTYGNYKWAETEEDVELKKWVQDFQKFDLYSKDHESIVTQETIEYYDRLLDKYFPNKLNW